jgi:hypothetical protein
MQFEEAVMYALWGSAIVLVIGVIYKYTRSFEPEDVLLKYI